MSSLPGPDLDAPADPEHDPRATYAVDPGLVRRLSSRVRATAGPSDTTYAPFTGQPIASIPRSTPDDVAAAVDAARRAQRAWSRVPLELRQQILLRLHDLVLDRQDEILDLIQWESGKARKHAFDEVAHVAMTARYYARTGGRHLGTQRRLGLYPALTRIDVNQVPKGVIGIISPWNYPFTMAISDGLAGPARRQRRGAQARLPDPVERPARDRSDRPRRACRQTSGRSCTARDR